MLKNSICSEYLEDLNVSFCKITTNGLSNLNWEKIKFIGFQECKIHGKLLNLYFYVIQNKLIQHKIINFYRFGIYKIE